MTMSKMSAIDIQTMTAPRSGGLPPRNTKPLRGAHKILSIFLMSVVAISPFPVASNRPVFWAISALLIGLAGFFYALKFLSSGTQHLRFPIKKIIGVTVLFALFVGFLILQLLPIGNFSIARDSAGGSELVAHTLSITPDLTLLMLMRQLGYGLFFFLVLQVAVNSERALVMLRTIFFITLVHAFIAMLMLTQFGDSGALFKKVAYLGSATGTFINRNSLATFLGMGAVAGLSYILALATRTGAAENRIGRSTSLESGARIGLYVLGMILIVGTLLATNSRMGLGATISGLGVVAIIFAVLAKAARSRFIGLAVFASVGLGALVAGLFGEGLIDRLGATGQAFDVRGALYAQIVEMIRERPFVGYGGGSFKLGFPMFRHLPLSADLVWTKAHSSYLALWSEFGIFAGSLPMVMIALFTAKLVKLLLLRQRLTTTIAALGCITVVAVHSLLDFSLEIQANTYLFLAILAIGVAGIGNRPKKSAAPAIVADG